MPRPFLLVLMCSFLLAGCTATARLYPVQGPLSEQNPPPIYVAKFSNGLHSGAFSAVLSNGEIGKGRWQQVLRPNKTSNSATAPATSDSLAPEWDLVYGQGFYTAHVLGSRLYARLDFTGDRGTVMHAEFYKPDKAEEQSVASIRGVAKDDKGNIYKVAF